ncbi:Integrase catalytic domain-containing protein [Citrus sinensis]|nr:Integrase catalytic domain-containing protein [Citrus sinensis]
MPKGAAFQANMAYSDPAIIFGYPPLNYTTGFNAFTPGYTHGFSAPGFTNGFSPYFPGNVTNGMPSTSVPPAQTNCDVNPEIVEDPSCYIDSGATNHITNDLGKLVNSKAYVGNEQLFVSDGNALLIEHIGLVQLATNTFESLFLNHVLHVPKITKNLLSVSKLLANNNVTLEFVGTSCFIKARSTGIILLEGVAKRGLYKIQSPSFSSHPQSVTQSVAVNSVILTPLQLLYADLWGPSHVVSSQGYTYYMSILDDFSRFTDIVNTLDALEKTFSNSEKVKKIIRSLPKEWRPKRTVIEEAKDLNTLPLDDLIGSLILYEEDLAAEKGHEEKKKSIALKASKYESDGESEPDDEELAMLARRFRKFFKKTGERRNFINFKNHREKNEAITCYECKKPGHIRSECPLINKLKKKAMVATWDDSEEESSDEEGSQEVSNLALMAIGGDDDLNEVSDPTYDELYDAFKDLHNELMKIGKKNGLKKKKNKWYLDSGCSKHMTGNYAWFSSFTKIENGGDVSFGDNSKGKILGIGIVGKVSSTLIENVCLVENLKHNLISISQLCDKGYKVIFDKFNCVIENSCDGKTLFVGNRCGNVYIIDIECASTLDKCFSALHDDSWLWHRRLGHASMDLISKISKNDLVKGLPKIGFQKDKICEACQFGKQIKTSLKNKNHISTSKPLELLHINLFGPSRYASLNGKYYAFVIVDDYSRYTWVLFLANKDDALDAFKVLYKKLQNEKGRDIICIRSDHGGEFENHAFENFCNNLGIEHQFSSPGTPQQNGVVERKNKSIQEMARTMLNENALPKYFWAEAVNIACYVLNRVLIRPHLNKTPYELWKDRKPNIGYFKVFGCKCFILNTKDNLGKFDPKSDVGIFLGYSNSSKAYRVYNKRTLVVEESMHVTFDESNPSSTEKGVANDDADGEVQEESSKENQENAPQENQEDRQEEQTNMELEQQDGISQTLPKEWRYVSSHPKDVILGDISRGVTTRSSLRNACEHNAFISQIDPKSFEDAENDESWIMAMQEELNQFERNNV